MAGRVFVILLLIGALLAHQLYKPLAALFFPENVNQAIKAIQYTTRGIEAFILYSFVVYLCLKFIKDWRVLFGAVLISIYGLFESFLIVTCATARIITSGVSPVQTTASAQLCGAVTGFEFFALVQSSLVLCFLMYLVARPPIQSAEYHPKGSYVGYKKPSRSIWSIFATLLMYPYAGKVYIHQGRLYKFSQGRIMSTLYFDAKDYVLKETDKLPPSVGDKWTLTNNCVTW